jgi:hypothetical protein
MVTGHLDLKIRLRTWHWQWRPDLMQVFSSRRL